MTLFGRHRGKHVPAWATYSHTVANHPHIHTYMHAQHCWLNSLAYNPFHACTAAKMTHFVQPHVLTQRCTLGQQRSGKDKGAVGIRLVALQARVLCKTPSRQRLADGRHQSPAVQTPVSMVSTSEGHIPWPHVPWPHCKLAIIHSCMVWGSVVWSVATLYKVSIVSTTVNNHSLSSWRSGWGWRVLTPTAHVGTLLWWTFGHSCNHAYITLHCDHWKGTQKRMQHVADLQYIELRFQPCAL
jgi:hypothetical protein